MHESAKSIACAGFASSQNSYPSNFKDTFEGGACFSSSQLPLEAIIIEKDEKFLKNKRTKIQINEWIFLRYYYYIYIYTHIYSFIFIFISKIRKEQWCNSIKLIKLYTIFKCYNVDQAPIFIEI